MALAQAFIDEANDRFGEALEARIHIRADTSGGSDQLIELTANEKVVTLSPVSREREREPGVILADQWGAKITNGTGKFHRSGPNWLTTEETIIGKHAVLELGFPDAGHWEVFGQGKIRGFRTHVDGTASIRVSSVLEDILNRRLPRPLLQDHRQVGWASPVEPVKVADGNGSYNSVGNVSIVLGTGMAQAPWEKFLFRFVSPTTFNIVYEDGTTQAGGPFSTGANVAVKSNRQLPFGQTAQINAAGWTGTFAAGDEFVFYTGAGDAPPPVEVTPSQMLRALLSWAWGDLNGGANNTIPDVLNGGTQLLLFDYDTWPTSGAWADLDTQFTNVIVRGFFERGRAYGDLIQGLLRIMNASLWPARTGQIGVWWVEPNLVGQTTKVVTGDPAADDPSILEAERIEDDSFTAQRVLYTYRGLNFTVTDGVTPVLDEAIADVTATGTFVEVQEDAVDLEWAATSIDVEAAANRHLNRFTLPMPTYRVHGTLTNLLEHDLSDAVDVVEPGLSELGRKIQLTQVTVSRDEQTVEIIGQDDPIVTQEYWLLGTSVLGTDTIPF